MNKTVLITGGSGAVGRALVRCFCRDNNSVAFTYFKNGESAQKLSQETGATSFQVDLTNLEQVQGMIKNVLKQFKHIDILVNNAGSTQICLLLLLRNRIGMR